MVEHDIAYLGNVWSGLVSKLMIACIIL